MNLALGLALFLFFASCGQYQDSSDDNTTTEAPNGEGTEFTPHTNMIKTFQVFERGIVFYTGGVVSNGKIYAGTDPGLKVSSDKGLTWSNPFSADPDAVAAYQIFITENKVYFPYKISVSDGNFTSFSPPSLANAGKPHVSVNGNMFITKSWDGFYFSSDSGQNFTLIPVLYNGNPTSVMSPTRGTSISTHNGTVFIPTVDGLVTTTEADLVANGSSAVLVFKTNLSLYNFQFYDDKIYAVDDTNGGLGLSSDGGTTWSNLSTGLLSTSVKGLHIDKYGVIYVSYYSGIGMSFSIDGGTSWNHRTVDDGLPIGWVESFASDDDNLYVFTQDGVAVSPYENAP